MQKLHWIGILRDIRVEEEVGQRERGKG